MNTDLPTLEHLTESILQFRRNNPNAKLPQKYLEQAAMLGQIHPVSKISKATGISLPSIFNKRSKMGLKKDDQVKSCQPKTEVEFVRIVPTETKSISTTKQESIKSSESSLIAEITTRNGSTLRIFSGANAEILRALSHLV